MMIQKTLITSKISLLPFKLIGTIALLTPVILPFPTQAENLSHLNQLLGTKNCSNCDLSSAGLVMANLSGANLANTNLAQANLSQANLSGADLRGANLAGASLYGANLTGANLTGANLKGTDLRNAYLTDANLTDVDLNTAYLEGARGILDYAGTPEQFHRWGLQEAQRGNYQVAIDHYNRAISIDSKFADAYLALGLTQYHLDRRAKAKMNGEIAAKLFQEQGNQIGYQASQEFLQGIEIASQIEERQTKNGRGAGSFGKFVQGIGSLVFNFLF
ncbi:MAG: pentapeptide repeat-containing protein [Xenococcaceae cyanobacterium MO_188.B32]|nr:pentapeptide repeat-containing protein [Xenococcaceae cyanobacterium MO_188.B32]